MVEIKLVNDAISSCVAEKDSVRWSNILHLPVETVVILAHFLHPDR